jgi:hypothetical protein
MMPRTSGSIHLTVDNGLSELDELLVCNLDKLLVVRCHRHRVFVITLTVETESGRRFEFRIKRLACKQIAARSRMQTVATGRSTVVSINRGEIRLSAEKAENSLGRGFAYRSAE